jgi:hypothetical protein
MNKNKPNKKLIIAMAVFAAIALELSILIIYKPIIGQQIISSWFESKPETASESSSNDGLIKLLAPSNSGSNLTQERSR